MASALRCFNGREVEGEDHIVQLLITQLRRTTKNTLTGESVNICDILLISFPCGVEENSKHDLSTHLYITDFQNLWVTKVTSVKCLLNRQSCSLLKKSLEAWFDLKVRLLSSPFKVVSHIVYLHFDDGTSATLLGSCQKVFKSILKETSKANNRCFLF